MRQQIKAYVAGQLAACTEADPDHPDLPFQVGEDTVLMHQTPCIYQNEQSMHNARMSVISVR